MSNVIRFPKSPALQNTDDMSAHEYIVAMMDEIDVMEQRKVATQFHRKVRMILSFILKRLIIEESARHGIH
jgi:hypothetical protein